MSALRKATQLADNPYLGEFMKAIADRAQETPYRRRSELVRKYAWAVPSREALDCIAKYGPVVEIGAGTGYWAFLLIGLGVDVVCYDSAPPDTHENHYKHRHTYTEVREGGPESLAFYPDRSLFLCWPPYSSSMATECLMNYRGSIVIYVGEGGGGCTGDDEFHEQLEEQFEEIDSVSIPQWPGIHDYLTVYRRRQ